LFNHLHFLFLFFPRSTGLQDVGGLFSIYRKADRCLVNVGEVLKVVESTGVSGDRRRK